MGLLEYFTASGLCEDQLIDLLLVIDKLVYAGSYLIPAKSYLKS